MTRLLDTLWYSNGGGQGGGQLDEALANLGESYVDGNGEVVWQLPDGRPGGGVDSTPTPWAGELSARRVGGSPPAEVILKAVSGGLHPLQERPVGRRDLQAPGSPRSP